MRVPRKPRTTTALYIPGGRCFKRKQRRYHAQRNNYASWQPTRHSCDISTGMLEGNAAPPWRGFRQRRYEPAQSIIWGRGLQAVRMLYVEQPRPPPRKESRSPEATARLLNPSQLGRPECSAGNSERDTRRAQRPAFPIRHKSDPKRAARTVRIRLLGLLRLCNFARDSEACGCQAILTPQKMRYAQLAQ